LISPDADFTANSSSNALVMTDTAANIRRVVQIVAALDANLADAAEVKVFQLEYASASGAANLINDLFGDRSRQNQQQQSPFGAFGFGRFGGFLGATGSSGGGDRGGQGGNPQAREGQRDARHSTPVKAASDDRTNTIVVAGPPET